MGSPTPMVFVTCFSRKGRGSLVFTESGAILKTIPLYLELPVSGCNSDTQFKMESCSEDSLQNTELAFAI